MNELENNEVGNAAKIGIIRGKMFLARLSNVLVLKNLKEQVKTFSCNCV